ncbi:hypothetical protein DSUL_140030 [Desulfovibrionales bacterium]
MPIILKLFGNSLRLARLVYAKYGPGEDQALKYFLQHDQTTNNPSLIVVIKRANVESGEFITVFLALGQYRDVSTVSRSQDNDLI